MSLNFTRGRLWRAGFATSGISGQNRMVERHDANFGAYWKSYDFKPNKNQGNLFKFPLGPTFPNNPFNNNLAFEQDGGEIVFHLPNGLQGYMLLDGKDNRINEGPIDVVSDRLKTSGTAAIVNGLSCMACHVQGMVFDFKDAVRTGSVARGNALQQVQLLYPPDQQLKQMMQKDSNQFLEALDKACGVFLRKGPGDDTPIQNFPETIGPIARWYRMQDLGPEEVAIELGMKTPEKLQTAVQFSEDLQRMGLGPLANGGLIKREAWESREFFNSPYQDTARILKMGTPLRMD
jgi:serine/threonine-protein kinase